MLKLILSYELIKFLIIIRIIYSLLHTILIFRSMVIAYPP